VPTGTSKSFLADEWDYLFKFPKWTGLAPRNLQSVIEERDEDGQDNVVEGSGSLVRLEHEEDRGGVLHNVL